MHIKCILLVSGVVTVFVGTLMTRWLQSTTHEIILNNQRLLPLHIGARIWGVAIGVEFLMLFPNNLRVTTLTMCRKHGRLRVVSLDLIFKFGVVLLLERLWLIIRKRSIAI